MKWSWNLGKVLGIEIYLHTTFVIFIGWLLLTQLAAGASYISAAVGVAFTLTVFSCVLLHELGHALAARYFGVATKDIILLPIGGVARLERMPSDPRQELWVAAAGPAVNIVIAAALYLFLLLSSTFVPLETIGLTVGPFAERLLWVNIILVLFNLLPAFPMDGGRILRALLAMKMEYVRATQIAAGIGQGLALILGFIGLFSNPFLVFTALFVWIGANQEGGMVHIEQTLGSIPVYQAMVTDFRTLSPSDRLSQAVRFLLSGSQTDFPVVDKGRVIGLLSRSALIQALSEQGENTEVWQAMEIQFETASSYDMLQGVLMRLNHGGSAVPVLEHQKLVGLVTADNVAEVLMIKQALQMRKAA